MKIVDSVHWKKKRIYRLDITDDMIEYALLNSSELKDRNWEDALNVICRIPPSGRILKVVFRKELNTTKIITAYWLD